MLSVKNVSKKISYALLALCIPLILGILLIDIPGWYFAIKWHLLEGNTVEYKDLKIELPGRWFVWDINDSSVLVMAASLYGNRSKSGCGNLIIRKKHIEFDELASKGKVSNYADIILKFENSEYYEIDNQRAFVVTYIHIDENGRRYIYKFITVPSKDLYVIGTEITEIGSQEFKKVLKGIKFTRP
ncbi:hypothetical protein EPN96_08075 [bacterium]|nr:MAG: hypothetical protein EPN96_08075 [bacterium]